MAKKNYMGVLTGLGVLAGATILGSLVLSSPSMVYKVAGYAVIGVGVLYFGSELLKLAK